MSSRDPGRVYIAPVQRWRIRYAKRGRLRFASHRDFQRSFERALRRAAIPMAYSAGFHPHPRISYANAVPTGVASEAEYLEIGLSRSVEESVLVGELDQALPAGFNIVEAVQARTPNFTERLRASHWELRLPGVDGAELAAATSALLAQDTVEVERLTKSGRRKLEVRQQIIAIRHHSGLVPGQVCAILALIITHSTPSVRPDDVLVALSRVGSVAPPVPPQVTRLAQGSLAADAWTLGDPLAPDRVLP